MILSFHPLFEADLQITCAGREPDDNDLAAILKADGVLLPQGAKEPLYRMARENCRHVFPNYDARFAYPDKAGQIRLFKETGAAHPRTLCYDGLIDFHKKTAEKPLETLFDYPFVFKFNWGGEGDFVFAVKNKAELENILKKAEYYEKTGQTGFQIQEYISFPKTLRVVLIGETLKSYWRMPMDGFYANMKKGALIEAGGAPELVDKAVFETNLFSKKTGINLAGFDFLFREERNGEEPTPLFLEINYFFGRSGLGGSIAYYALLEKEIMKWMATVCS